jgi:hypothetical protein
MHWVSGWLSSPSRTRPAASWYKIYQPVAGLHCSSHVLGAAQPSLDVCGT